MNAVTNDKSKEEIDRQGESKKRKKYLEKERAYSCKGSNKISGRKMRLDEKR